MSYTIPNAAEATTYPRQAQLERADLEILARGSARSGVAAGLGVTANGTNLTLTVAAGVGFVAGRRVKYAGGTVAVGAAHATNPRIDLVTLTSAGALSVVAGTAAPANVVAAPALPAPSASVVLAQVYVPAAVTALTSAMLTSRAVPVIDSDLYPATAYGAVPDAYYYSGAITSGAAVVTATANLTIFALAAVGMKFIIRGAGASGADLTATIQSINANNYQLTLDANASTTVSGAEFAFGTDSTAGIQAAIDAASAAGGGRVALQPAAGSYLCLGRLTVKPYVVLAGPGVAPLMNNSSIRTVAAGPQDNASAQLLTTANRGASAAPPNTLPFIELQRSAGVEGFVITYPLQTKTNPPQTYPVCIKFADGAGGTDGHSNGVVRNMLLTNPYRGVEIIDHERALIDGLFMDALSHGVYCTEVYDVPRLLNIHIWNFWEAVDPSWASPTALQTYRSGACVGYEFKRVDELYAVNLFCYGLFVGFLLDTHSGVGVGYGNLTNCGTDQCVYGVVHNDSSNYAYKFTSGLFITRSTAGRGVYFGNAMTGPGSLMFVDCTFQSSGNDTLVEWAANALSDSTTQFQASFVGCIFDWKNDSAASAVKLASTATSNAGATNKQQPTLDFVACKFKSPWGYQFDSSALTVSSVFTVVFTGNLFHNGRRWNVNASPKRIVEYGNYQDGPQVGQVGDSRVLTVFPQPGSLTSVVTLSSTSETLFGWNVVIPANSLRVGQAIRLIARGTLSTHTSAGNWTMRVKFGTTVLAATATQAMTNSLSNRGFEVNFYGVVTAVGASGAIEAQGFWMHASTAAAVIHWEMRNTATVTFSTVADQTLQMSLQTSSGNANNVITMRQLLIEVMN